MENVERNLVLSTQTHKRPDKLTAERVHGTVANIIANSGAEAVTRGHVAQVLDVSPQTVTNAVGQNFNEWVESEFGFCPGYKRQTATQAGDRIAAGALVCAHEHGLVNITCRMVARFAGMNETSVRTYATGDGGLRNLAIAEAIATRGYPVVVLTGLLLKKPATRVLDDEAKRAVWRAAETEFFKPDDD